MPPIPDDPSRPVSEEDRDTAVRRLQDAYSLGHIPHEEMDALLHQALTAETHGDLATPLASLPEERADTSTITALSGRIRRRGPWRVPRNLKVESAFGEVHLNLARAIIEHPVVDIELQLTTGKAKITVPRDAVVEIEDLSTVWKDSHYKPRRPSRPGGPKIRISGTMGFGRLKIRHARR
ncbi:DUF1707 SHOCT-like domain-containing protein [Actinomadura livida]|uniref:DUF1707 domain-containing protein n=1 Tax=Actinomadura livida TaxID=79909 RepID=A0A7W7IKM8_9ACTN|nr:MULTISPECIES: DUF1707 domain-containing protein [Actinomadura]MBB4778859.1 hypothetical protein [Actinomadura catellatispora]GGU26293.1 hypothetical protein GCM10010208_58820 [Actinomadura livida]